MQLFHKSQGKGKAVVLLHGFLENHKMWHLVSAELAKNHQIIIPDLLGHGESPTISKVHTMELQAEWVKNLLDDLNIEKASIIGHSMGGYIALKFAKKYPEKVEKLGLFFSNSNADTEDKKQIRARAAEIAKKDKESFIRLSIPNLFNPKQLNELSDEINQAREWAMETPLEGITAALLGMREKEDTLAILRNLNVPKLVMLGEFDPTLNTKEYAEKVQNISQIQIKFLPVGHMGHLEAPNKSLSILKEFLS